MTRFKNVLPLMIYVPPVELAELKNFAKAGNTSVSQIAREGIRMRMDGDKNPYNKGFNDGLTAAMEAAQETEGAQMRFPSGESFGQLVCAEIEKFKRSQEAPSDGVEE